jgi:hypothetical protein
VVGQQLEQGAGLEVEEHRVLQGLGSATACQRRRRPGGRGTGLPWAVVTLNAG